MGGADAERSATVGGVFEGLPSAFQLVAGIADGVLDLPHSLLGLALLTSRSSIPGHLALDFLRLADDLISFSRHLPDLQLRDRSHVGHKHGVEPSIGPEEHAKVKERFQRSKVRLLSFGSTCEFQSPDPAERKKQIATGKAFVDLARDTGAIAVKVRPNGFPNGVPHGLTIHNIGMGLRELGEYGQLKGIEIWMEVHGTGTMEPGVAAEILAAAANPNVGACWNSNPTDVKDGSVKQSFQLLKRSHPQCPHQRPL